jgi:hypothetical protein
MQIATHDAEACIEENGAMRMDQESPLTPRWIVFGTAVVYFALGSLLTAHFMQLKEAFAGSHRAFRLEIHRTVPGKVPAMGRLKTCPQGPAHFTAIQPVETLISQDGER